MERIILGVSLRDHLRNENGVVWGISLGKITQDGQGGYCNGDPGFPGEYVMKFGNYDYSEGISVEFVDE